MDLNLLWFVLISVLLAGYAVLDGFDLGVGIIHPIFRTEKERQVAVKAIGPLWDGNEVWLVTFGGALFAAFPEAYATLLSALYIPVMALLFCLILRAVSVDFYAKVNSKIWKLVWDAGFTLSSIGATFIFGVAVGILLQGLPLDERATFTGQLTKLINFYSLATGGLAIATFSMHGTMFLFLKTMGDVRQRLEGWLWHTWGLFLIAYILVSMMTLIENPHVVQRIRSTPWVIPVVLANVLAVANMPRAILNKRYGQAFASSCLNILCLVALFAVSTFPDLVYSTGGTESLTVYNAASSQGTLTLMAWMALIGLPLILSYTAIIYWTFRQPIQE